MKTLYFATTNQDKYHKVQANLAKYDIAVIHYYLEMDELQCYDGEQIARDKAKQAFNKLHCPVLVNDDSWAIPALHGFPSTGMKLCNKFLTASDWLRLMSQAHDRTILLISHYAICTATTLTSFSQTSKCFFLKQKQGVHPNAPCLEVIRRADQTTSIAEDIAHHNIEEVDHSDFWFRLAQHLNTVI